MFTNVHWNLTKFHTMKNKLKEFGQELRKIRHAKGGGKGKWSLREVAKRAGIRASYLSMIETGKLQKNSRLSPELIKNLSEALQHPYQELMHKAGHISEQIAKTFQNILLPFIGHIPCDKLRSIDKIKDEDKYSIDWRFLEGKVSSPEGLMLGIADGNCLKDAGYNNGDYLIFRKVEKKNLEKDMQLHDIVLFRQFDYKNLENQFTCKYFNVDRHGHIILTPANKESNDQPIVINPKGKEFGIEAKLITGIKSE